MSEGEFNFGSEEKKSESSDQVLEEKNSNSKRDKKMDYEDKITISMTKAKKARDFHKKEFSKTLMDSPETVEPDSIKKKSEQKTRSLDVIAQIIGEFEVISWDTESQPASSEEIEEDSKDEAQVRWFSNSITDVFDLHEEEGDNNCMFSALSRTTFGSPDYNKEVRALVVDYMTANRERFSSGQNDFEGYLILLRDYHAWGGQKELQAFAELYDVNIEVYDRMTCSNPMYHISSGLNIIQTIRLFYSGNHYDSVIPRDAKETLQIFRRKYEKMKKKDFMKKEESKMIKRKKYDRFANDYSTTGTDELFKSIANYWNNVSYSKNITDKKKSKKRKEAKRGFRRLACKNRRFKVEKSEDGDLHLFKNLNFNKYEEVKKEAFKNEGEDSDHQDMTIEQEIDVVTVHAKSKGVSIYQMFDWREIPKKEYKNEIIHKAHTFHKDHLKAGNTLNRLWKVKNGGGTIWGRKYLDS